MIFADFASGFALALCICSFLLYLFAVKERYLLVHAGFCLLAVTSVAALNRSAILLLISVFFLNILCFWFSHDILLLKWRDSVSRIKYITALVLPAVITFLPLALYSLLIFFVPVLLLLLIAQAVLIAYKFGQQKRFDQIYISENERITAELDIAREIQSSILPNPFFPFPGRDEVELFADSQPGVIAGCDFYDYFFTDKYTLAFIIADASPKGAHPALFMALAKSHIKAAAKRGMSPDEIFESVNNLLCEESKEKITVTAFLGLLHMPRGRLTYANANHYSPIILHNGSIAVLTPTGDIALACTKNTRYTKGEINLRAGDCVFLYTDGVILAQNNEEESYGDRRLADSVSRLMTGGATPMVLIRELKRDINDFLGDAVHSDDITMLALKIAR